MQAADSAKTAEELAAAAAASGDASGSAPNNLADGNAIRGTDDANEFDEHEFEPASPAEAKARPPMTLRRASAKSVCTRI